MTSPVDSYLGSFLRERREELGLTAEEVARRSQAFPKEFQVSQSFLSQIENQKALPSPLKLLTLARIYRVPIARIYEVLGASHNEIGISFDRISAAMLLYPDAEHRGAHDRFEELLSFGLGRRVGTMLEGAIHLLDENRAAMKELIEQTRAECACVVTGDGEVVLEVGLTERDRRLLIEGDRPEGDGWVSFREGSQGEISLSIHLKNPQLGGSLETVIAVSLVRWWAVFRNVVRRFQQAT